MSATTTRRREALCGANLKDHGQNARIRMGIVALTVALGAAVAVMEADLARPWRVVLFVPFFFAAFGAWQGLYRTCPGLVMRGTRETQEGDEVRVADPEQTRAARRLATKVMLGSVATAACATALLVALP
ncbi:MAG: hypothetical protein KC933_25485 [Myxococcales bacterium]|nr:hypothetical protein [Myxococcales bacterium]MCB9647396.1 hypothetical protein [Deltaproteobacteria bacterium]